MTETMRQIADAGEALGFLCSSVRCGTEWGPEHDQARDVLRAALRRVAEPVDRVERMAKAMKVARQYADENDEDNWCMRIRYGQCSTRKCMVAGGWTAGNPGDFSAATCTRWRLEQALVAAALEDTSDATED